MGARLGLEKGEGGQLLVKLLGIMYNMGMIVNNTVLSIWKLLTE